jgi:hypothetical protein
MSSTNAAQINRRSFMTLTENKITGILLTLCAYAFLAMISSSPASAIELLSYKDSNAGTVTVSRSAVTKAWNSDQPACLKDAAKLLGVNKAFKSNRLGYRDCSNSAARKKVHSALGFNVVVFKLSDLPTDMIKEIKGKK